MAITVTRTRVFVFLSILAFILFTYESFFQLFKLTPLYNLIWKDSNRPKQFPCVWKNEREMKPPLQLPQCLWRWRNETQTKVRQDTSSYLSQFLESHQEKSCSDGSSKQGFIAMKEWYHQPHFGGQYFFYISLMLWQDFIFESQSCLKYFMFEEESVTFWGQYLEDKPTWAIQMLNIMKDTLGQHVVSSSCAIKNHGVKKIDIKRVHNWFIHPSDAYWLGSTIMKEGNVCESVQGQAATLIAKPTLQFTLLQRAWARKILNSNEINALLSTFTLAHHGTGIKSTINYTSVNFETETLPLQVQKMRETDIVLTVHGAGVTNVAFMKPCSIAIEIVPFALGIPPNDHYFGALARSADVLHYSWIAEKHNSVLIPDAKLAGGWKCKPLYNPLPKDMYEAHTKCYNDKYCRACCKLTTITVNTTTLSTVLTKALNDRALCLKDHPLYK